MTNKLKLKLKCRLQTQALDEFYVLKATTIAVHLRFDN
jgi:hypothetical protein